jgi:hypothetical protein
MKTIRKRALWALATALVLSSGLFAYQRGLTSGQRVDCPGKIVCPLTGQLVCRDRCPLHPIPSEGGPVPKCCRQAP